MEPRTIHELFGQVVARHPERTAYRHKRDGRWLDVTWREQAVQVESIARALVALGVGRGAHVAILSQTRLEWVQCDLAAASLGAIVAGIYPSLPVEDCAYILEHAEVEVLVVENPAQLERVLTLRARLPRLRHIVVLDGAVEEAAGVMTWATFRSRSAGVPPDRVAELGAAVEPDDVAAFVYTSGTTGIPRAAMLTHRNLVFTSGSAEQCLDLGPEHVALLFLPLAHVFARIIVYVFMRAGATIAFAEDLGRVPANLLEVRPHVLPSVPRIYEKVRERILSSAEAASPLRRRLFHWALGVGRQVSQRRQRGAALSPWLALSHRLATALVLRKVPALFGGRLVFGVSGGAPLDPAVAEFFHACGVTILEGYGMSENTSFTNVNRLGRNKFGTVGPAGPGIDIAIAADGEILVSGPNVMRGYHRDPQETAEAIDAAGWLHTGDIGEIDADGFLRITGRKKDLIITAGGKNVAPQRVERALAASPLISQVLVCGDRHKFISALVTLHPDAARRWAAEQGLAPSSLAALADDPRMQARIRAEIDRANEQLAPFESVKRFRILPAEFTVEAGELTPTLKIKRRALLERYRSMIDELYAA